MIRPSSAAALILLAAALGCGSDSTPVSPPPSAARAVGARPLSERDQTVKAWIDTEGSQSVLFSATGQQTLVLHFDGTTWTRSMMTVQYMIEMNAGWAASPSIAFAAGKGCQNPFVLMFTDGAWSGMDTCAGTSLSITSVWGTAANDVWAVGTGHGSRLIDPDFAWVFHFDGSSWTTSFTDGDASHPPELLAVGTRPAGRALSPQSAISPQS